MRTNYCPLLCGLIIAACAIACCSSITPKFSQLAPETRILPDSVAISKLGNNVADVLFHPSKVYCWSLKGKSEVKESDFQVEPHFVRDSLLGVLKPEELSILQFLLLSEGTNYQIDSIIVSAPYIPSLEFEFTKKKSEPVHVVISTSDLSWSLIYNNKKQFNYNYGNKRQMNRFCKGFIGK